MLAVGVYAAAMPSSVLCDLLVRAIVAGATNRSTTPSYVSTQSMV